jgi:hypothetical protein
MVMDKLYKLSKLDKRHKGFPSFSHRASFKVLQAFGVNEYQTNVVNFNLARNWMVEQYGPGVEIDHHGIMCGHCYIPLWAWDTENHRLNIYLTEKELLMFQLRWA